MCLCVRINYNYFSPFILVTARVFNVYDFPFHMSCIKFNPIIHPSVHAFLRWSLFDWKSVFTYFIMCIFYTFFHALLKVFLAAELLFLHTDHRTTECNKCCCCYYCCGWCFVFFSFLFLNRKQSVCRSLGAITHNPIGL